MRIDGGVRRPTDREVQPTPRRRPVSPSLRVSDRMPEIAAALLDLPHDHLPEPHRSWLREQYRCIVPVVLADALRAVEEGVALSPDCLARLRELAADCRRTDVPLAVSLRAAVPAVAVFCRFVDHRLDGPRAARLVVRACVVAQELGSTWLEACMRVRATAPTEPTLVQPQDSKLEAVDVRMLALVAEGRSNEEIATVTHYSRQAVGWRLSRLMRRWQASNRAALTAAAFTRGVLGPDRGFGVGRRAGVG